MKKLIAAGLIASLFAFSVNAQTAPNATVNPDGSLLLEDGSTIPVPDGTIDGTNLVLGDGTIIPAPTATINPDGSLDLGDGTILDVPDLPQGGAFITSWFGSDLFDYEVGDPPEVDQQYFSFHYKDIFHYAASNWFFFLELKATLFIFPDSGNKSLDGGFWAYTNNLLPGQTSGIFMFISGGNSKKFQDLRDSDGDGTNDLADSVAGFQVLDANIYLTDANGYDTNGAGWFWFSEYRAGNYIIRVGDPNENFVKLSDPIGAPLDVAFP